MDILTEERRLEILKNYEIVKHPTQHVEMQDDFTIIHNYSYYLWCKKSRTILNAFIPSGGLDCYNIREITYDDFVKGIGIVESLLLNMTTTEKLIMNSYIEGKGGLAKERCIFNKIFLNTNVKWDMSSMSDKYRNLYKNLGYEVKDV